MPRCHEERAEPVACPGSSRGFLVGRRRAGFGAGSHLCTLEDMGQGVPAFIGLLGASSSPHTLRSKESQDTASVQGGASRVSHACPDRAAASAGSEGLAHMGSAAGTRLTSLKSCWRKSLTCHSLGNAIRPWRSLVDALRCPACSGYPRSPIDPR